jgi:hypothetical protein
VSNHSCNIRIVGSDPRLTRSCDFPANRESCFHGFTSLEAAANSIHAWGVFEEVEHLCGASRRAPEHFHGVLQLVTD